MPTLELTPKNLIKKSEPVDVGSNPYDWTTQTRFFPDTVAAESTALGADTGLKTQCGQMFSDDTATD